MAGVLREYFAAVHSSDIHPYGYGEVGAFVPVRTAVTDAKAVKFVSLDPGLNLFPADLLADKTATVVTASLFTGSPTR